MEIPHKFWKEYEEADLIEREEKLKVIIDRIDELSNLKDEKQRKHALKIALLGYFDDLLEYKNL